MEYEVGTVYILRSRNLLLGVWNGRGFIGLREKFGRLRLDEEYIGPPAPEMYHTVRSATPLTALHKDEVVTVKVRKDIPLKIGLGSRDKETGRPVAFDKPVKEGGRGWYFTDTGESSEAIWPQWISNFDLFEFLLITERAILHYALDDYVPKMQVWGYDLEKAE